MVYRRLLGCILFLNIFMTTSLFGQQTEIKGILADSVTKQPLPYGTVMIKNSKDSLVAGVLTDEKGMFHFNGKIPVQTNSYIQASYAGHKTKKITLSTDKRASLFDMGMVLLAPENYLLKEATIIGMPKYMDIKFDRKVFTMNDTRIAAARSVLDLLRTLPGVVVDDQGNVRYRGAQATIYVDDQPAEFIYPNIEMIPVHLVQKIELIDAAMYNSSSNAGGIINFKLKKTTTEGLSGMISGDVNTLLLKPYGQYNGFLNLNYKTGNYTFFNNFVGNIQKQYLNQNVKGILNYGTVYTIDNESNQIDSRNKFSDYAGVKYTYNDKLQIYLAGGFWGTHVNETTEAINRQTIQGNDHFYDFFSNNGRAKMTLSGFSIPLWVTYHFSKNETLEGGAHFEHIKTTYNPSNQYVYSYINDNPVDSISKLYYDNKENRSDIVVTFLYSKTSKNDLVRWRLGFNGISHLKRVFNNKAYMNDLPDLSLTTCTDAKPQHYLLWGKIGLTWKKWKINGGMDVQYDKVNAFYIRYPENRDTLYQVYKKYFNLLPSLTVAFAIDSVQELKLTYNRSVNTPVFDFFSLCDYIDKSNPRSWQQGNSALQPVNTNNFYFSYTFSKEKFNLSTEAFFSQTNNENYSVSYPISSTIQLNRPENIAFRSNTGIDISAWMQSCKVVDISLSSTISHTFLDASSLASQFHDLGLNDVTLKKKNFGFIIKLNSSFHFSPTLSGMLYVNYFSREIIFEGYKNGYFNSTVSITKKLFGDKLFVTIGIRNLLDGIMTHGYDENYAGITQKIIENSSNYKQTYFISLHYKIGYGDRGTKDYRN